MEYDFPGYRVKPDICGKISKVFIGVFFTGGEDKRWRYIQRMRQRRATRSRESTLRDWATTTPPPERHTQMKACQILLEK